MNISMLRLLAVSVLLLSSQCLHLVERTEVEVEVGPAPPFQVIEGNTRSNRLDVWQPLRSSLADSNNKVRQRNLLVKRKKTAAQRPGEKQSFHLWKLEETDERDERDQLNQKSKVSENYDDWLSFLDGSLQSLVAPLVSLVRSVSLASGLVSQGAEDRQSLVDSAQVSQ